MIDFKNAESTLLQEMRRTLLDIGFQEATRLANRFYKEETALTAYFVNLKESDDRVSVYYGYASTAFTRMKNDENALIEYGVDEDGSCLRSYTQLHSQEDIPAFFALLKAYMMQYAGIEKDELLALAREKRKAFIGRIAAALKPYGFKKKGNQWTKQIAEHYLLYLWVDKSSYADRYAFDVSISAQNKNFQNGYYCTGGSLIYHPDGTVHSRNGGRHDFDWQIRTEEALDAVIQAFLERYVIAVEKGGMAYLGAQPYISSACKKDCCSSCWISNGGYKAE
ncbi:MAG: hypothetical protein IJ313_13130 [Clostridia bacterium]|nr:hypothetical protein [Clostridia bacterium]